SLQFPVLCSECAQSYYLNQYTSECIACSNGCNSCDSSHCISCQDGFDLVSNVCYQCDQNCHCDQNSSCKSCKPGYFLISTNAGYKCVVCNPSNYDASNLQCIICNDGNCATCKSTNLCTLCDYGYFQLTISQNANQCVPCSQSGYFGDSTSNKCMQCPNNCSSCDSTSNCTSCNSGYYLQIVSNNNSCVSCSGPGYYGDPITKKCIACSNNCQTCDLTNSCISCQPGYYLLATNGVNSCVTCNGQGYFKQVITQICIKCPNKCITCDQNGSCTLCEQFYYKNFSLSQIVDCQPCNSDCYSCNESTNKDCIQCNNFKQIDSISKLCVICDTQKNYIQGNYCIKCDNSCLGCNGITNKNCLACNQNYYRDNNNFCLPCKNTTIKKSQTDLLTQRCQKLIYKCQLNPESNQYENTAVCEICQNKFILSDNFCVYSCEEIGENFIFDINKNKCVCQNTYPYLHINSQDKRFCSQFILNGYYCNSNNICYECNKNCLSCSDSKICLKCSQDFFLWQNQCLESCLDNMIETVDSSDNSKMCACQQGYFYSSQVQQCIQTLQVVSIKKKSDIYNVLIFKFNRVPMGTELQNINLTIDQQKLVKGTDYTIVSQYVEKDQLIFDISVPYNRQIQNINLSSNQLNFSFKVSNTILTTNSYNQSSKYTDHISQQMDSFSQALNPQNQSTKALVFILKNFQLFCFLSNFIQIFGALIAIQQHLPTQLQGCFIYGASFIFQSVPSSEDIPTSQVNSIQTNQTEQIFLNLSLDFNIFKTCPIIHLEI
ncbi:hypothetical protein ABPG74_020640, partial [Tetrahymena malaccensis]